MLLKFKSVHMATISNRTTQTTLVPTEAKTMTESHRNYGRDITWFYGPRDGSRILE